MTSTRRAILVSEEQRPSLNPDCTSMTEKASALWRRVHNDLAAAYDNAGDQPRIQWCVKHSAPHVDCLWLRRGQHASEASCRVVGAIIVPVEEGAA